MKHNYDNVRSAGLQLQPARFEFTQPTAATVCVAGTFNQWQLTAKSMHPPGNGHGRGGCKFLLLCLCLFFTGVCAWGAPIVIGYTNCLAVTNYSQSLMNQIGQLNWYFAHASVGGNMMDGIADLHAMNTNFYQIQSLAEDGTPPSATTNGIIYEYMRGNPGWQVKFDSFQTYVSNGWCFPKINLAMNKLCFIDQTADLNYYIRSMTNLESAFPQTLFVYTTMPLMYTSDSDNYLRNVYNDGLRAWVGTNNRVLYDIADIEAHDLNGVPVTFTYNSRVCQRLCDSYTTDGGHLNVLARQLVAKGFYALAAAVIYSGGQPPVANNDSYSVAAGATLNVGAPGVLSNDTDAVGNGLQAVLVSGVGYGTMSLNTNGSFIYTPTAGYSGPDSFTYKANDGAADSGVATVTLTVTPPWPVLALNSTALNFSTSQGTSPANQLIGITNGGGGTLNWTAVADTNVPAWLTVSPNSGTGNGAVNVSVVSSNLAPGTYSKSITVTAVGATNSPQMVTVNLTISGSGTLHYDFIYPDRAGLLAGGWDFLARTASGAARNTEQTTGAVVSYDQLAHPGVLRIPADVGDMWAALNNTRNSLFRDVPTNWTSLRLKFSFAPTQNSQQAGLLVYQNDDNYVQMTRSYNGGNKVEFVRETGGSGSVLQSVNVTATVNLHLRLDRDTATGMISGYYSLDNTNWTAVGSGVVQIVNNPRFCVFVGASPSGLPNADLAWAEVITPYTPPPTPNLTVAPAVMNFSTVQGAIPTNQSLEITNSGGGTLNWTVVVDTNAPAWLAVTPTNGTGNGPVNISVANASLASGTYTKNIAVTAVGATNNPQTVTVNLTVNPAPPLSINAPGMVNDKFGFGFLTQSGVTYFVEYKDALDDPAWQTLTNVAGTGSLVPVVDPAVLGASRFYRIRMP